MARKDVDLVIRAKDEAEKVVKSITAAINDFTEAQKNLTTKADKTENSMQALGAAFGQLQKDLRGGSASDLLAKSLDKANASVERLEKSVSETRGEVRQLDKDFRDSSAGVETLRKRVADSAKALDEGRSKLKSYQTALAGAKKESAELAAAEKALKIAGLETQLERKAAAAQKTEARLAELRAQMEAVEKPTKRLTTSITTNTNKLAAQQAEVKDLTSTLAAARDRQAELADRMAETGQKIADTSAAIKKQEGVVAGLGDDYDRVAVETREAEKANADLRKALDKTNGVLERQEQQLDAAQNELKQFAATSQQAESAIKELSGLSIQGLEDDLGRQRRAMLEAKREYVELTQQATELAAKIGLAGVPTREMVEDFERLKIQAGAAKAELNQQRQTLELMGRAFRDSGTDMESLTTAQARFVSLQGQAGAAIQTIRSRTEASVASLEKLHAGYQNAANSASRLARSTGSNASSMQRELTVSEQLARAYRNLYGEKRTALSLTQRLRGEVLSLVAAYGGLYGVIDILRRTVDVYKQVEAAQARLNVAFDGNPTRVGYEMDFLRRNAERLGVEFGVLATEYSKFSIATKNTAIEGDPARKLFLQIAEAARVNRSSMEEMQGVFTAVTQIVNKGAVQMEELRQQLGDRLPGAIQLMADGLGVTTAELVKMMEQGQVTAEALVPFGEELEKRFGPQLAESLTGTAAEMGRLQNAAFEALRTFGEAGFIDSFTDLLRSLSETLQSADAEAFIERLSVAFGGLLNVIGTLASNFDLVAAAMGAFIGVKMVPFALAITGAFKNLRTSLVATNSTMVATQTRAAAMGVTISRSALAVRGLSIAIKGLLSSTGIGLAVVAISTALGYWATQADAATEAMTRHEEIVDQVKNAYDLAGGSVEAWREAIADDLSITEARKNLREVSEALQDVADEFDAANRLDGANFWTTFFGGNITSGASREFNDAVEDLVERVGTGEVRLSDFRDELDKISEQYRDGSAANERYAEALDEQAAKVEEAFAAYEEARSVLEALTGDTESAQAALDDLSGAADATTESFNDGAAEAFANFRDVMQEFRDDLPGATDEMGRLNTEIAKIDDGLQTALTAARALPDAIMRIAAEQEALAAANEGLMALAQGAVDSRYGGYTDATEAAAAVIRQFEGFRETPYWDVNAYRVGYGSDTITLSDGTIQQVVQGMRVSVADANRDLLRRIGTEFMPIAEQAAGSERFATFTPQQQAALTSIAYNYGEIPDRIAQAVRTGTNEEIADAIRSLAGDNAGVNRDRRFQEAALFTSGAATETQAQEQQRLAEQAAREEERRLQAAQDFHDATNANIEQQRFELSIADQELIARQQALAIREAELAAQEAGTELTEQQRQAILANVEAQYREQAAEERLAASQEARAEAEERVNRLLEHRANLKEQLDSAVEAGETEKAEALRSQIEAINEQLMAAIENAKAMWQAVGGEEGDAAIARLETLRLRAEDFGKAADQAYFSWAKVGDLLINGLASAFDTFAQKIADGENAFVAARDAFLQFAADFLIQIAQMIIKQAILNALSGTSFGSFLGIGVAHTGGVVGSQRAGSGNVGRKVNPAVFSGAMRYHVGGLAGLRPGEVPIIAKQNEEILTRDDPRHILNGGGQSTKGQVEQMRAKIVNAIDAPSFLEAALNSPEGEKVFLNFMKANQSAVSGAGF